MTYRCRKWLYARVLDASPSPPITINKLQIRKMAMLTSEQVLHFHTFGFLVVKRAFSLKEMQDIINVFDESMLEDRDGQPFDGEERQAIFGLVERNPYLVNLIVDQRIFGAINQLFGPGFLWTASDANYWVGDTQWHPDRHNLTWALIKATLYLDPVTKDTGCLRVIPGSHQMPFHANLMPLDSRRQTSDLKPNNGQGESFGLAGQDTPSVSLETVPGDLIFFHQNLWHSSFGGRAGRRQLSLSYGENPVTDDQMAQVHQMYKANLSNATERANVESDHLYGDALMTNEDPQINAVAQRLIEIGLK